MGKSLYKWCSNFVKITFFRKKNLIFCGKNDSRHVSVKFYNNIVLDNFYVPAGGDIPDPVANPKFKHKLDFLNEMKKHFQKNNVKKEY